MKIAVSSSSGFQNRPVVSKLETSEKIIIFEPNKTSFKILDNEFSQHSKDKSPISLFVENQVSFLITHNLDPRLHKDLSHLGIQILLSEETSIFDAVDFLMRNN